MKKLLTIIAMVCLVGFSATPAVSAASKWQPFGGVDCSQAGSSAVCQDGKNTDNPLTGGSGLLAKIANIIAVVAGMAAVIIIVLGGLRLITSGGRSENVAGARRSIIYAAVGLVIIVISRLIIGIILNAL